ncbi:MAG: cation-transporting P-type ATPase [Helicobacteraceae bacterium]|nr:cation-transporting P-type ATPase [Helicobacteraceae bacterium]
MEKNAWHSLDYHDVLEKLESSEQGLSAEDAQKRLEKYGPNKLQEQKKKSAFVRFMLQFHNLLIYVLLVAALVTFLLDHMIDSVVILSVVIINAIIGFIQENRAENAMESIRKMLAFSAIVMRDGKKQKVNSEDLVIGDIVLLESGDRVLADTRLFQTHGFSAQEALLTGESAPVDKTPKRVEEDATIGDRYSMVFAGTTIASGKAKGVVVATANQTELGLINGMLGSVEVLTTPLVEQMDRFAKWLTLFILSFSVFIFMIGYYLKDIPFTDAFMAVVGLFVAAIPEGLPAVLTITLAIGVQAMAKRNAIVRHLPAIETIGSVSVICSDKTGTLTQNEMMVQTLVTSKERYSIGGSGYEPTGDIYKDEVEVEVEKNPLFRLAGKSSILCSDAQLENKNGVWSIDGSPTEGAIVAFAHKVGLDVEEVKANYSRDDMIPFDSKHKFMATLNHNHQGDSMIVVKGAAEIILKMCTQQYVDEENTQSIDRAYWEQESQEIASKGQRVLALAYKKIPHEKSSLSFEDLEDDLVLIAFVGLIDPPRPEAIEAVKECHSAGIDVKMITGDHAITAAAIGRTIGLKACDNVLSGSDIEKLSDEELGEAVLKTDIFARTTPEHKLRLVTALQAHSKVVAMTGDGVNDAPALKRSNVGIAMGKNGTEAAKESSEFVLTDDNFASIVSAVREGRRVYDNIKKVISWTLPTNASEASVIIIAILFGMAMPITPIQILWANMITAVTLGIALAFEGEDKNIMKRAPRALDEPILSSALVWQILYGTFLFLIAIFSFYYYAFQADADIDHARTLAFNTLVFMEIFYLFYVRNMNTLTTSFSEVIGSKAVWIAVSVVFFAQMAVTYIPFFQHVFATTPLSLFDFTLIIGAGFGMYALLELEKYMRIKRREKRSV